MKNSWKRRPTIAPIPKWVLIECPFTLDTEPFHGEEVGGYDTQNGQRETRHDIVIEILDKETRMFSRLFLRSTCTFVYFFHET